MKLLLLLGFCLFSCCAQAQNATVTGRVTDRSTGQALPGATVLQLNTTNGVSSNEDGSFALSVPDGLDSISLTISAIGYVRQQRRVAAGSNTTFSLEADQRQAFADDVSVLYARYEIGLTSGLRYAPYGVCGQLFLQRLIGKSLTISGSYQTNLSRNYATNLAVRMSALPTVGPLSFSEKLEFQRLRAEATRTEFTRYSATLGLMLHRKVTRLPELLLGTAYARYQPLRSTEARTATGFGYGLGLRYNVPYPLDINVQAQATRWPTYWQFQGSVSRFIGYHLQLGVAANQLPNYTEFHLSLSRSFY